MNQTTRTATEFGENAALLGQVAGLVLPNRFIDGLDPQKRNTLLVEAITDFILSKADQNPLVLVLDDLHWGDSNSLKVIDRIITRVLTGSGQEVFLLLLHRPDFAHTWPVVSQNGDNFEYILLDRLRPEQIEPLVRQFLEEWLKVQEPERVRQAEERMGCGAGTANANRGAGRGQRFLYRGNSQTAARRRLSRPR